MSHQELEEKLNRVLHLMGIKFSYTKLGEPVFAKKSVMDIDVGNTIPAREWSPRQLEMIAHLMREFPDSKLFNDEV